MHTDAKFGLIVGVVLVLAVAVLFFPSKPGATPTPAPAQTAGSKAPPSAAALLPAPSPIAKPTSREASARIISRSPGERTAETLSTQK